MSPVSRTFAVALFLCVGFIGISANGSAPSPQQQTFAQAPQFIPGAVTVTGSVSVENSPTVQAQQAGEWHVSLAEPPVIYWRSPTFLKVGGLYRFTSPEGVATYRVVELGLNGWIGVASDQRAVSENRAWLNVGRMMIIEDVSR